MISPSWSSPDVIPYALTYGMTWPDITPVSWPHPNKCDGPRPTGSGGLGSRHRASGTSQCFESKQVIQHGEAGRTNEATCLRRSEATSALRRQAEEKVFWRFARSPIQHCAKRLPVLLRLPAQSRSGFASAKAGGLICPPCFSVLNHLLAVLLALERQPGPTIGLCRPATRKRAHLARRPHRPWSWHKRPRIKCITGVCADIRRGAAVIGTVTKYRRTIRAVRLKVSAYGTCFRDQPDHLRKLTHR